MIFTSVVATDRDGGLWHKAAGRARRACGVADAAARLRKTRRQIYRYLSDGTLRPLGKFLGEWLLDQGSVESLAARPACVQPIPARLQPRFPEYRVKSLNAGRDRTLVIARLLEDGDVADLRWLLRRYRPEEISSFLRSEGARLLSPRAQRLWSLYFKTPIAPLPDFRREDPWRKRPA